MSLTLKTVGVDDPLLLDVIALGDANRKTLGFLPWAGFSQAATRGTILAAVTEEGHLAGYCLYDLPGNIVRITHLCINRKHRGQKVGRYLIDAISDTYPARLGLKLKCRTDWDANTMWPKLGFIRKTTLPGRSKDVSWLAVWWRSHGHDDLFSVLLGDNDGTRVAVDANVYSDLHSPKTREGSHHSAALAPLVANQEIKLVVTVGVLDELYLTKDEAVLQRYLDAIDYYEIPETLGTRADGIQGALLGTLEDGALDRDPSLRPDAMFIAEAVCAGVEVVVSRDEDAVIRFADYVFERFGVTVLNPSEIRTFLDAAQSPNDYLPDQLRNTGFRTVRAVAKNWRWDTMQPFFDRASGERKVDFTELLRKTVPGSRAAGERFILSDRDNRPAAAWATQVDGRSLNVPFLRVAASMYGPTIAKLLTFHLRQVAIDSNCSTVVIADVRLPDDVLAVLKSDGFAHRDGEWSVNVLTRCGRWEEMDVTHEDYGELPPPTHELAEIERTHWPLRLLGGGIPTYLVPIRGTRSADLLGYPVTLDARPDFLGLSREHVYYKASGGIHLDAPGRIVWYASGDPQEVVGCSRLIDTITGAPSNLHRQFARYGVYNEPDVREAAGPNGLVKVLRFADTELFENKITLNKLKHLAESHSKSPNLLLQSAHRIDDEMFELIYREGTGR